MLFARFVLLAPIVRRSRKQPKPANYPVKVLRRAAGGSLPNNRMTSTRPCKADRRRIIGACRRRIIGAWLKVAVQDPLPGSAGLFSPVLCSVLVSLTFGIPLLLFLVHPERAHFFQVAPQQS